MSFLASCSLTRHWLAKSIVRLPVVRLPIASHIVPPLVTSIAVCIFFGCLVLESSFAFSSDDSSGSNQRLQIAVAYTEPSATAQQFIELVRNKLPDYNVKSLQLTDTQIQDADFYITLGKNSLSIVEKQAKTPLLAALISRTSFLEVITEEAIDKRQKNPIAGIFSDPSPLKQLALIDAIYGQGSYRPTVAFLATPRSRFIIDDLTHNAALLNIHFIVELVENDAELPSKLASLKSLHNFDTLLLFPDRTLYNANNIKQLLLSSYRNNKPIIGFSPQLVDAGATATIYYQTEAIANESVIIISEYFKTQKLPRWNYPKDFDIAINQGVADSLNLPIKNVATLKQMLVTKQRGEPR